MKPFRRIASIYFLLSVAIAPLAFAETVVAGTKEELETQIQAKSKQLDALNQALQTTQANLKDVQAQKATLQKEIKTLDYSVKQLGLNIQADEVSTQKIGFEINSLNYDIRDLELSMDDKKKSISDLFRELQRSQNKNTLMLFLENKTLADGLTATQSLESLRTQLAVDIDSLKDLHSQYEGKVDNLSSKKKDLEYHQENLKSRKQIAEDLKQERANLLSETKDKESVYQKQVADLKKLQESIANEVEALDAQLRAKVDPKSLPTKGSKALSMPLDVGLSAMTQGYGSTDFAKNGYRGHWHNGIDFGIPIGTPILAAEAGTVLATGNQDTFCYRGAYGKFALIKHPNNLTTLYGHLSKYIVSPGDTVSKGQVIGYSGKTGYATGPHLHFTVFSTPTIPPANGVYPEGIRQSKTCGPMPYGGDLNPLDYL